MLETSKDVLNIVLAVSVFSFTFFVCWALFYLVMTMQQMYKGVKNIKKRIDRIEEVVTAFKDKIENSASYLLLIGEGVKMLVDVLKAKAHRGDDEEDSKK